MSDENILNLSHSKLSSIPHIPDSTIKLDLRRNQIEDMTLFPSINLIEIDLSDNKISRIQSLEYIPNIKFLDLSYNLISEIKLSMLNLEELYLICNDITKIETLNLPNLKKLDLAVNEIKKIENLEKCPKLTELYLGSNKIREVPDLTYLESLKVLDLQNNFLVNLDCKNLPKSLTQLLLSENEKMVEIKNIDLLTNLKLLAIKKTSLKSMNINKDIEIWHY